ncbi:hypothetical protein [Nocardioides sp. AE5]|uniref:hypothetical protein n=1 Tax=Nocardioides sp. AE5 TaxID=2962573 RepID=UPI00288205B5|nr:hypothetical protein [Nocardioides sp. AE5]MDT0202801.1 hypothetical protein [Nocardioides sp. AE5]
MDLMPAAALIGDPFWDTVRARHPDVNLVVLPPAQPADPAAAPSEPAPAGLLDLDELEERLARARAAALSLWGDDTDAAYDVQVQHGFHRAPGADRHQVRVRAWARIVHVPAAAPSSDEAGQAFLDRLADALGEAEARRSEGPVLRLDADSDGGPVHATYAVATGVCQLECHLSWEAALRTTLAELDGGAR